MQYFLRRAILVVVFFYSTLFAFSFSPSDNLREETRVLYNSIDFAGLEKPGFEMFYHAMAGYHQLVLKDKIQSQHIITLIDFSKPSSEKRLWIIDIENRKVLFHTLVAHGRNSGDLFANKFSNKNNSHQSSLGFYITGQTYIGKHGLSLKLSGLEPGINDQAEARAIVIHGADYVSDSFVKKVGRLGRSFGCPAIPSGPHKKIIGQIAGGSCLFIYYPDEEYLRSTQIIKVEKIAAVYSTGSR